MAFAGEYSGFGGNFFKDFFHNPLGTIEQTVRPFVKAALPAIGAIVGTIVLPGVGTALGATIGGSVTSVAQSKYESHEVKKDIAAQESAIQAQTVQTVATAEALKMQSAEQQPVAQAGFFSKPSGLMTAALAIGLIAYVPPLKKRGRGRGRKRSKRG